MIRIALFILDLLSQIYLLNDIGTGITGGGRGQDRDRDRPNPRRNDDDQEVGTERETGIRDDIENGGVVRETETERGATEGSVPRGTEIARENGILSEKEFQHLTLI